MGCAVLSRCGSRISQKQYERVAAEGDSYKEQLLLALKSRNENIDKIQVFDENTDPNGKLGRPGYMLRKMIFQIQELSRLENICVAEQ